MLHTLGTPTKETWPDLTTLPDYNKITFSPSPGTSWSQIIPDTDSLTLNLISSLVQYDHAKRPTAREVKCFFFVCFNFL